MRKRLLTNNVKEENNCVREPIICVNDISAWIIHLRKSIVFDGGKQKSEGV